MRRSNVSDPLGTLYSQHPPANRSRCWATFQQNSQSPTVEWVITSTQTIRRWTIAPQSVHVPASGMSFLRSWVSMKHHPCIRTSSLIADARHELLSAFETHQISPQ